MENRTRNRTRNRKQKTENRKQKTENRKQKNRKTEKQKTDRLGVAEGLQHRIGQEDFLLDLSIAAGHLCQVHEALLGALGLARTALTADDDRLVLPEVLCVLCVLCVL